MGKHQHSAYKEYVNILNYLSRSKSLEEELEEEQKQQSQIQTDLQESKDQCAHTERLFHQSQRESEQKIDELTRINQHIPVRRIPYR